jgi:hypothetical protein
MLQLENAALGTTTAALQERIRELEARLGQNASHSPVRHLRTHAKPCLGRRR